MPKSATLIEQNRDDGVLVVTGVGEWTIDHANLLGQELGTLDVGDAQEVRLDLSRIASLDTAGALLLADACGRFREAGLDYSLSAVPDDRQALLDQIADNLAAVQPQEDHQEERPALAETIAEFGAKIGETARGAVDFVVFLGLILTGLGRLALGRGRLEPGALFHHMQRVWLSAVPIVGFLAFLVGMVSLYQGSTQLARFGAQGLAINMVGIVMLREFGAMISALIVAGRSGSSFTAQIGSMKARQEVDAMRAIGIDPILALVLPRVLALLITFPLLVFFADVVGLVGGGLVAWLDLGVPPDLFVERLRSAVDVSGYLAGLAKAPVFAVLIGLVGCFQGMKVEDTAEVGGRTTRAVVQAVFLIIVADSLFSLLYRFLGV